jgi:putative transposase
MGRSLRLEYAGALYHITSRGDRREDIYKIGCHVLNFELKS